MPRTSSTRFPGLVIPNPPCKKECKVPGSECDPITKIKKCPPAPFIKRDFCRAIIFDRGVIVKPDPNGPNCFKITDKCGRSYEVEFLIETFGGLMLIPTNLERYCGLQVYKDNDVIAIEAEDDSEEFCTNINALPVKIMRLSRVWKKEIRTTSGKISKVTDANSVPYYMMVEIHDQTKGDPYHYLVANTLKHPFITISYAICNVTGVGDFEAYLDNLLGRPVEIIYVDYGKETPERCGIPIVITDLREQVLVPNNQTNN